MSEENDMATTAPAIDVKALEGVITVTELQESLEFRACSPKQQKFVLRYIATGGNSHAATLDSYEAKDIAQAKRMSYEVEQNSRVRRALDLFLGVDERTSFVNRLRRKIESGRALSISQIKAAELYAKIQGWDRPECLPRLNGDENVVPVGCRPMRRKSDGAVVGYIDTEGKAVEF